MEDTTVAIVESREVTQDADGHTTVSATVPGRIPLTQSHLLPWIANKIRLLAQEQRDLQSALEQAIKSKFQTKAIRNSVNRLQKQIDYYQKLEIAIEAGYVLFPSTSDVELFAVRTGYSEPDHSWQSYHYGRVVEVPAERLPEGVGEYVSNVPITTLHTQTEEKDGKPIQRQYIQATDYQGVGIPLAACRAELIEACNNGMQLKVFDEIGLIRGRWRRSDPVIVGIIRKPNRDRDRVTFFLGWFVSTRDLE